jgi:hypothetical protein
MFAVSVLTIPISTLLLLAKAPGAAILFEVLGVVVILALAVTGRRRGALGAAAAGVLVHALYVATVVAIALLTFAPFVLLFQLLTTVFPGWGWS